MDETVSVPARPRDFVESHPRLQHAMLLALLAALVVFVVLYGRKR